MAFFPQIYEDEIVRSVFSRYHKQSGNTAYNRTKEDLFGNAHAGSRIDFPSKLNYFCSQLSNCSIKNPQYFIDNHTIFPFYKPFLQREKQEMVIKYMKEDNSPSVDKFLNSSNILKNHKGIKVCPYCLKLDKEKYGESYIHRFHQIPGNTICLLHVQPLIRIVPEFLLINKVFLTLEELLQHKNTRYEKLNDEVTFENYNYAVDSKYLLENSFDTYSIEKVREKYYVMLKAKGFMSVGNMIKQRELYEEIHKFYTKEFLLSNESYIEPSEFHNVNNWIRKATSQQSTITVHPLRHLLLIRFLFGGLKEFHKFNIENDINFKPFGSGPWYCMNPVAEHYKKAVIDKCVITRNDNTNKPIGTFSCSCGFVYTLSQPYNDDNDKVRSIKQYGHLWEDILRKNVIEEKIYNINKLSKIMKISRGVITRYLRKLGLIGYFNVIEKNKTIGVSNQIERHKMLETFHKKCVVDLITNKTNITRTQVINELRNSYRWLNKHNKEWLEDVLPKPIKDTNIQANNAFAVNWKERDNETSKKVIDAIYEIKLINPPVKICLDLIRKKINYSRLSIDIEKLPKTKHAIKSNIESKEDFQIRYIDYLIENQKKSGQKLIKWEIRKKANLYTKIATDKAKAYFDSIFG